MQVCEDEGYVENGIVADLDWWWSVVAAANHRVLSVRIKGPIY
jgi:hypothetical protein